jgi:Zn-dependent protease with chaperone function
LPPTPRRLAASHPGLIVPSGQWASWTIVDSHPTLVYRIRAGVESR